LQWRPVIGIEDGLKNQFNWGCNLFGAAAASLLVGAHASSSVPDLLEI
jgi:hypothetical protein